jgi:hypothetical protein
MRSGSTLSVEEIHIKLDTALQPAHVRVPSPVTLDVIAMDLTRQARGNVIDV